MATWRVKRDGIEVVIEVAVDGVLSLDITPQGRAFATADPDVVQEIRVKLGAAITLMQDREIPQ